MPAADHNSGESISGRWRENLGHTGKIEALNSNGNGRRALSFSADRHRHFSLVERKFRWVRRDLLPSAPSSRFLFTARGPIRPCTAMNVAQIMFSARHAPGGGAGRPHTFFSLCWSRKKGPWILVPSGNFLDYLEGRAPLVSACSSTTLKRCASGGATSPSLRGEPLARRVERASRVPPPTTLETSSR